MEHYNGSARRRREVLAHHKWVKIKVSDNACYTGFN
jgi:hypothetical protein